MRHSLLQWTTGAAIALGVALCSSTAADAQSVMKFCGDQWKAAKAAETTNGETWPQFLAQCRAQQSGGGAAPTSAPAPSPAAPGQADGQDAGKTTSQCDAEYAANTAAIKGSGQTNALWPPPAALAMRRFLREPLPLRRLRTVSRPLRPRRPHLRRSR